MIPAPTTRVTPSSKHGAGVALLTRWWPMRALLGMLMLCEPTVGAHVNLACLRSRSPACAYHMRLRSWGRHMTRRRHVMTSEPVEAKAPAMLVVDIALPSIPSQEAITVAVSKSAVGLQATSAALLVIIAFGSLAAMISGNLRAKLTIDIVSGCAAAIAVSPFVALVDGAIARSLAQKTSPMWELRQSLAELMRSPRLALYRADFYFTAFVYVVTYCTANIALSLQANSLLRLALITCANMWSGVKKDAFIARSNPAGGVTTATKAVGITTIALFCARDINAIGASFVLPRLLAPHVSNLLPQLAGPSAAFACQLLSPPICELLNTQVHLLALDTYNRPGCSAADRISNVARSYPRSLAVRIIRVLVAFSLGGMGNRAMRCFFQRALAVV